jgi:cytochrome c5
MKLKQWCVLGAALSVLAFAHAVPPGTVDEIRERLKPFGQLCRAGEDCGEAPAAAVAAAARSGAEIYNQFCFACHATGVGGAPLFGDAEAWEPRVAQGMDLLWEHTVSGLNAMPPMGTCMNCSDEELRASLDYMLAELE